MINNVFIYIFKNLNKHYKREINAIREQYPFEDLVFDDKLLILTFKEASEMLKQHHKELLQQGKVEEAKALQLGVIFDLPRKVLCLCF